jgi:hypothetical protein
MDKPHYPQVIRTWTVARIKVPFHTAQPAKPQREPRQGFFSWARQNPSSTGFQRYASH